MTTLVVGATGATGRLLVEQLLRRNQPVKAVVRAGSGLPAKLAEHPELTVLEASLLDLDDGEIARLADGCGAVASCLGHRMSWKGIYGRPRRLVTDAIRRLCGAIEASQPEKPVRLVLMNTAGNSNRDLAEPLTLAERSVLALLRLLLPPHADNERAADYLRTRIGQNDRSIEWVAVRPDTLTDEQALTPIEAHPSPIRSAIFDPGATSRINVAGFIADLITDDDLWQQWKGRMPVIYNKPAK